MLSTPSKISQHQTSATTAENSSTLLVNSSSSPPTSVANIKCEPFAELTPLNESAKNQTMLDETINTASNLAMDACTNRDLGCSTTSTIVSTSAIRQKSNNKITGNASSPIKGTDHSNSSNVSPNLPQSVDSTATDIIPDLSNAEKNSNKKQACLSSLTPVKEEDGVNTSLDKQGNVHGSSTKNFVCSNSALNLLSSVKGEVDSMTSSKNEDGNISPDMSPAGFGSISTLCETSSAEGRSCTPVLLDEISKSKTGNTMQNNKSNLSNNEKATSVLGNLNNSATNGCPGDSHSVSGQTNTSSEPLTVGGALPSPITMLNNSNCGIGNCTEYMQQQNHIFVFSTQLANKGAESVLSGQFPTIITYHCTQPATKTFLEDFFIKNPIKISKMQRQNSIGLCNIPGNVNSQQWVGNSNTVSQMMQKANGNKINFTGPGVNLDNKVSTQQSNITHFSDVSESLVPNENDLMCWEQTRKNGDEVLNENHTGIKVSNGVVDGSSNSSRTVGNSHSNKCHGTANISLASDSGTPSLQGIKVPDENLTPQQRQHREEQLAKLKQIDQFLSNPLQGGNQLSKLGTDSMPGNLSSLMLNLSNSGSAGLGTQINNSLNTNSHNVSNAMNLSSQNVCNRENIITRMIDENIVQSDNMNANESENVVCRANEVIPINNKSNMLCGPNVVIGGPIVPKGVGNISSNMLPCHVGTGNNSGTGGESSLKPNSPDIMGQFKVDGNLRCNSVKSGGASMNSQEMDQVGISQIEWCKLQHQLFEERMKSKSQGPNETACIPPLLPRSNSTIIANASIRISTAICSSVSSANTTPNIRSSQGPPPPYHLTQRSASVPITTQSQNPGSPNNPTSHRSLPSPRTSAVSGVPTHSPNVDSHAPILSTTVAVTSTSNMSAPLSNPNNQVKTTFQPEDSPTSCGANNCTRNNQFNSNPSTPLAHISPKDIEPFHSNIPTGDLKTTRSPQRARSPTMASTNGSIVDTTNIEVNFTTSSPGLSFSQHVTSTSNSGTNSYKGAGAIEHQHSAPMPLQFGHRMDNLPLNPNSGRLPQKKLSISFDPISSLAQMSQQLTSCVPINAGCTTNTGGTSAGNDVNIPNTNNHNMECIIGSMDSGVEHSISGSTGNMSISQHISGNGSFMSNNCHINSMLGPMGQRLLNPKVCAGYSHSSGGIGRDGPGAMHDIVQTHRLVGRMGMNFGSFNAPPNIQVKASTPNTIQYMPVRTQNHNINNMRVPPSLEFLRYTPAQISGTANMVENTRICHGNPAAPSEAGKIHNTSHGQGGGGISFFGNQIDSLLGNQEDLPAANLVSGHNINIGRGMRSIRQIGHTGSQIITGARMQAPVSPMLPSHFSNGSEDPMECNSMLIGNNSNVIGLVQGSAQIISSQSHMFPGANNLQKSVKSGGAGNICQNINTLHGPMSSNGNMLSSDHISSMQPPINNAVMIGSNGNMLTSTMHVGNNVSASGCGGNSGNSPADIASVGYKPFVGPVSSDVKYAQQYHSFQQQLYATSTRSQNTGNNNIGSSMSTNTPFFANK